MEQMMRFAGMGLACALLCVMVRQQRPDFAALLSLACGVMLLSSACALLQPVLLSVQRLLQQANIQQEHFALLLKAIGITYLAQFASDVCMESGEKAIAGHIQLLSRVVILLMALPLYLAVFQLLEKLAGGGL
ncbi:MAG: SpoIIIAC/SpoIIIAD family protein [Eubacteriales bacterium]|jgi:stage III sporulation protein AD